MGALGHYCVLAWVSSRPASLTDAAAGCRIFGSVSLRPSSIARQ